MMIMKYRLMDPTSLTMSDKTLDRFLSYGWHVESVDGYDSDEINLAIIKAKKEQKPSLISCKTLIGNGSPNKQGTSGSHGALGEDEIKIGKNAMGWNYEPFYIPDEVLKLWRDAGSRNKQNYQQWIEIKKIKSKVYYLHKVNLKRLGLARKKALNIF